MSDSTSSMPVDYTYEEGDETIPEGPASPEQVLEPGPDQLDTPAGMPPPEAGPSTNDVTDRIGEMMAEPEMQEGGEEAPPSEQGSPQPGDQPVDDAGPDISPDPDYQVNDGWADASGGLLEKAVARFADYGWSGQMVPALIALWNETSSQYTQSHTGTAYWRPDAENYVNGAYGVPGLLRDTYESLGVDPMQLDNPDTQIAAGLEYIKGRYGNPVKALQHMRQYNYY
jgi:hypothetical protein